MLGADGPAEEPQERLQIAGLRGDRVVGVRPGLLALIQVEPGNQIVVLAGERCPKIAGRGQLRMSDFGSARFDGPADPGTAITQVNLFDFPG